MPNNASTQDQRQNNGRKPLPRIPSVPPDWNDLKEEVNRKEELTQHTFKCVVALMMLAQAPVMRFPLSDYESSRMSVCHKSDLPRLFEYCYDNGLIVLGCGEDPVMFSQIRKYGRDNLTVYLTAAGVEFYSQYIRVQHHWAVAGDICIGPQLTDSILH